MARKPTDSRSDTEAHHCERCSCEIDTPSHLCVSCYRDCVQRCPYCTNGRVGRDAQVLREFRTGGRYCIACQNDRWILVWPESTNRKVKNDEQGQKRDGADAGK